MISHAYIQEYGNGKMEPEHQSLLHELKRRGVKTELFTAKRLQRNQLKLSEQTLVVGDHPTIRSVFKRLGINYSLTSYPEVLWPFMQRKVWETTAKKLFERSMVCEPGPIFIKPKYQAKLFTGFLAHTSQDLFILNQVPKDTILYCSTPVEWCAEYRIFVLKEQIIGIKNYSGDPDLSVDSNTVQAAISAFSIAYPEITAYSLDFGLFTSGETALVEWNDAFALGSYDLDPQLYTDLILTRWEELIQTAIKL